MRISVHFPFVSKALKTPPQVQNLKNWTIVDFLFTKLLVSIVQQVIQLRIHIYIHTHTLF